MRVSDHIFCSLSAFPTPSSLSSHSLMFGPFFSSSSSATYTRLNPVITTRARRTLGWRTLLKWSLIAAVFGVLIFFIVCRVDLHLRIYVREWISPRKPVIIEPLSDGGACFQGSNDEQPLSHHTVTFMPGNRAVDDICYGFAATVRNPGSINPITFHTTWPDAGNSEQDDYDDDDDPVFTETHLAAIRSFAATQDQNQTKLILWIDPRHETRLLESPYWQQIGDDRITYQKINWHRLAEETTTTTPVYRDPVLLRLWTLYRYGGVWFDMNTLFVRDLAPLLEQEWIAQGNCFTSVEGNPFQGTGLLHFQKKSPYLCEMLNGAVQRLALGQELDESFYYQIYRRVLHHGIRPWAIVPWCFTDPSQCKRSNSLPSPFTQQSSFKKTWLQSIFAFHWHENAWPAKPSGDIFRYLQSIHQDVTGW